MQALKRQPRYQFLADILRQQITSGAFPLGSRMPSEPELSRNYGVSRGTVVKAVELLVAEGLAVRKQGSGTFVAGINLRRDLGRLLSFTETVSGQGYVAEQRVLSFSTADRQISASLGCFEPAMRLERVRLVDGLAAALHSSFVPKAILAQFSEHDTQSLVAGNQSQFSLYSALENAGHEIASASEIVTARLAMAHEQQALSLNDPSAVTVVTRQTYSNDERLLEVAEAIYPAERYTYKTTLARHTTYQVPLRIHKDHKELTKGR
jgi:GntR family transcriptional regulator